MTFIVMFAAAFFISSITARIKRQTHQTALRVYRTEILLETSQKLQQAIDEIQNAQNRDQMTISEITESETKE